MIVDTRAGKIEGREQAGVLQFRGVPYGQAERFGPPQPATPWSGIRDATKFGPVAPQNPSATDALLGIPRYESSEDCLRLNVFTPAADDARRPVLVWIHGGGFTNGSGQVPHYDGTNLARRGGLVVVTINYRLGALGFLQLDEALPEFSGSANNGLRDQIAALRWVRDNIAGFGGDPSRVTLFGESAGAMSIATLLAVPEAAGLFYGAITESGAGEYILAPEPAGIVAEHVLAQLDLSPTQAHRLLDIPPAQLVAAQTAVESASYGGRPGLGERGPGPLQLPFQPVIDGTLVPAHPHQAVLGGSAAGIPLVAGTTHDEWNLFNLASGGGELTEDRLRRRLGHLLGRDRGDEAISLYRSARPQASNTALWCAILTDQQFRIPAVRLAEAQAGHGSPVAMYRFDYPSAAFGGLPGACHTIEIPFVFDNVDLPGVDMLLGGVDDGTRLLAERCSSAWIAMAHTGRPEHDDLRWPDYEASRRWTCILDRTPAVLDDPEGELRAFWEAP